MGPNPYKQGYRDGWEAATNFLATYIQDLLEPPLTLANCAVAGAYEPAIDDADRHVLTLECWRDDVDDAHSTPPPPVRSMQRVAITAAPTEPCLIQGIATGELAQSGEGQRSEAEMVSGRSARVR